MAFKKLSDLDTGGSFFKPADHSTDLAILFEPKSIKKNVENVFKGKSTVRDEVIADVSVFANSESIDKKEPSKVLKNVTIHHGALTRVLEGALGDATIGRVRLADTKSGNTAWVMESPTYDGAEAAAVAYYESREAAVSEAAADAPSFD